MKRQKVIIMGAAGRDFHNFNMVFRNNGSYDVRAFTATQIPFIGNRIYPPELAGELYPKGIPILPEEDLRTIIEKYGISQVVFAYSDVSHEYVMHKASFCLSLGMDFLFLGPEKTMIESKKDVISVCAVRTGCGKSGITKYVLGIVKQRGLTPAAIRHPMPYCDLLQGRFQRLATIEDMDLQNCTIEEREEYEPLVRSGVVVFAGVDYEQIVESAEREADILVWDGGNNDMPFIRPDLEIVVLDPHRAGHELSYYPGETNLMRADIAVINKVDTAKKENIRLVEENIRMVNPGAIIVHTASRITTDAPARLKGKKVLVVEDGPTLTHGGMPYGAGFLAARRLGAEVVDPRPFARGTLRETLEKHPSLKNLLPAMGYSPQQISELKETIESVPCDYVLVATPVDLKSLLDLKSNVIRVSYEIEEMNGNELRGCIEGFVDSRHLRV